MISQPKNRVQAIKSKFENLNNDRPLIIIKKNNLHLNKQKQVNDKNGAGNCYDKENIINDIYKEKESESDTSEDWSHKPNTSYLYNKTDVKRCLSETTTKKTLSRQISDPGKKLQRSHAFRCDRSQKIVSPKRHGSCNGRSETSDFSLKMEKRLSRDRLKRLGNLLEDQMRKENFIPLKNEVVVGEIHEISEIPSSNNAFEVSSNNNEICEVKDSIPDSEVPQHILDQYAKVIKPKKSESDKQDAMTDSGVSSETENLEEEKTGRIKKFMSQFEKSEESLDLKPNLDTMNNLCISSETIRLERKNPHLVLTDTLKKALKQPLPPGPPPKKPPRTFIASIPESPEKQKKDTKKMLEKLEQVLQKRESQNQVKNEYDIVEFNATMSKPKEIHYLCTEILDIAQRTLLPNQNASNCFKSLNCAITNNSMSSLPYTRLSNGFERNTCCCSCSNDSLNNTSKRLSTFLTDYKCKKCQNNEKNEGFKCHLNCKCRDEKSAFFIDKEHIYDEPFNGECDSATIGRKSKGIHCYGTLNHSKSLEDLRINKISEDQKIYDIPCDISRPSTPDLPRPTSRPKSDFEKLLQNFEAGFQDTNKVSDETDTKKGTEKPPMKPKPIFVKNKLSRSSEFVDEGRVNVEKKFATESKIYRRARAESSGIRLSPKKDSTQLDVDRENLNRLMNEIYATVTEACNMDDNKPGSFPTDQSDGSTSEGSVKITRSLTEKRKNYVRRVSSRVAYLENKNTRSTRYRHQTSVCSYKSEVADNPYSTFRSWKSFRTSQNNLSKESKMADRKESPVSKFSMLSMKNSFDSCDDSVDNLSVDEKTGCVDELPFDRERGLFNMCLLVGLNYMTGKAYVKNVFPSQVKVPLHIENLIFPETLSSTSKGEWSTDAKGAQCYSLVLTDERGERCFGYCRRVLPEGATNCLPLCYCLIGKYRAPGFYYKVLQEIESHHGSSDVEIHSILQQLFETDFPQPGEEITLTYCSKTTQLGNKPFRNSVNLGDILKCKTMPDMRHRKANSDQSAVFSDQSAVFSDQSAVFSDQSSVFSDQSAVFSDKSGSVSNELPEFYDLENNNGPKRVLLSLDGPRTKILKRPIEPRVDEDNLSVLLDCLGAGLTIKVFGSLLLERKVFIIGDKLSLVSSCLEALQSALYPFVWQQPLISTIPSELQREILETPLPMLAGMLRAGDMDTEGIEFEEGMLIDLTHPSKVLCYQRDESSILPTPSYKTLKTSLQMESKPKEDLKTRNVMISEAFMRFFVDILGDFWRFFSVGELREGGFGKGGVVFDKDLFVKNSTSKQNQYFLEWFTETAMFYHFIQNMAVCYHKRHVTPTSPNVTANSENITANSQNVTANSQNVTATSSSAMSTSQTELQLVDTPLPDFYELFEERVKSRSKTDGQKYVDGRSNYKNAVNKRVKLLKTKLRDLVA